MSMPRYIDADALKELMIETLEHIQKNPKMTGQEMHIIVATIMLCEMIDDAPTIDAEPVRHGRWIFGELGPVGCDVNCSECGWGAKNVDPVLWFDYDGHKHCGCCGAKMDEKEND